MSGMFSAALMLMALAASPAAADPLMTRFSSSYFNALAPLNPAFPYEPFDPNLGTLKRVRVSANVLTTVIGTAHQSGGWFYPIHVNVTHELEPLVPGQGFSFVTPLRLMYQGLLGPPVNPDAPLTLPITYGGQFTMSFELNEATDRSGGIAPVDFSGAIPAGSYTAPQLVEGRLDNFTAPQGYTGGQVAPWLDTSWEIFSPAVELSQLPKLGGSMLVQYDYVPRGLGDEQIDNGNFDGPDPLDGWQVGGEGTAEPATQPGGSGNQAALLTTGSPVTLSQMLTLPDEPFELQFDYSFLTETGTLDVMLGSIKLAELVSNWAEGAFADFERFRIRVDDPALLGLADPALLALAFDGPTDSQVLIDNVSVRRITAATAIPEPATLLMMTMMAACTIARRPSRRRAPSAHETHA